MARPGSHTVGATAIVPSTCGTLRAMELGAPQIVGIVGAVFVFLFTLWALIDLLRRPHDAFVSAGVSRPLWLVLLILSLFCTLGVFVALWYLFVVSPKVRAQQHVGGLHFPDGRAHH